MSSSRLNCLTVKGSGKNETFRFGSTRCPTSFSPKKAGCYQNGIFDLFLREKWKQFPPADGQARDEKIGVCMGQFFPSIVAISKLQHRDLFEPVFEHDFTGASTAIFVVQNHDYRRTCSAGLIHKCVMVAERRSSPTAAGEKGGA